MDILRLMLAAFFVAGFALPVWGAVRSVNHARRALKKQERDLTTAVDLAGRQQAEYSIPEPPGLAPGEHLTAIAEKYDKLHVEAGIERPWPLDGTATLQLHAVSMTLRIVFGGNGFNAALIVAGLVLSTVASIWSLYLPAL